MKCGIVYPSQFTVWITCLLKSYEDALIGGLVKRGLSVQAASPAHLTIDGEASVVIGLQISTSEDTLVNDVSRIVKEVMDEHNFLYYSIVASATAGSSWYGSNISLPSKLAATPPPIPEPDKSNLN